MKVERMDYAEEIDNDLKNHNGQQRDSPMDKVFILFLLCLEIKLSKYIEFKILLVGTKHAYRINSPCAKSGDANSHVLLSLKNHSPLQNLSNGHKLIQSYFQIFCIVEGNRSYCHRHSARQWLKSNKKLRFE